MTALCWASLRSPFPGFPSDGGNGGRKADFSEFCGVWSKADMAQFEKNVKDLRKVDPEDWQ